MCRCTIVSGSLREGTKYQSGAYKRSEMSVKRRLVVFQLPYIPRCVCKHWDSVPAVVSNTTLVQHVVCVQVY